MADHDHDHEQDPFFEPELPAFESIFETARARAIEAREWLNAMDPDEPDHPFASLPDQRLWPMLLPDDPYWLGLCDPEEE